ncbi:Dihydropteroate synthase [Porphyromonadaceae bacterium KH3R12]|uniref:dihydropteroate synthase n=1 Tax=Proteiniphilum TaxID=294702 RepID=UPI000897252D|nr:MULTISPECIES: dihydropteroate synthase [Proteiniphilum]MDY9920010.1 dihydropteroate synthase [Proteiniphilum sp.]SDZ73658.1 Dihydropteroate synthase [Porphyromonadaceae bacterium KH3R12]
MKTININGQLLDFSTPRVMGIVNVTPDSFFSGSRTEAANEIIKRCARIIREGGTIIDVGAQSSSPASRFLDAKEETERLMPALKLIRNEFPDTILSVDTFYADVAKESVEEYGVNIINDISGGQIDERMFPVVAQLNVPYILMHMRGTPQTMQQFTHYDNFIQDILYYFSERKAKLNQLGVSDVIIDPGFGFSKTISQNYELMAYLKYFHIFEEPILVGISRKSMIYKLLGTTPEESLNGTSVLNAVALLSGADILRVHDVKEAVECVKIIENIAFDS